MVVEIEGWHDRTSGGCGEKTRLVTKGELMLNGLLERIFADGQASALVAVIGVLAGWFGPKLVKKPDQPGTQPAAPTAPTVHLPGVELLGKLGDHLPILTWFSQLPEEQRAKFFEALKKRAGGL